jgi:hypothetical protein
MTLVTARLAVRKGRHRTMCSAQASTIAEHISPKTAMPTRHRFGGKAGAWFFPLARDFIQ